MKVLVWFICLAIPSVLQAAYQPAGLATVLLYGIAMWVAVLVCRTLSQKKSDEKQLEKPCPSCGKMVSKKSVKCQFCGFDFLPSQINSHPTASSAQEKERMCPRCGRSVPRKAWACPFCEFEFPYEPSKKE